MFLTYENYDLQFFSIEMEQKDEVKVSAFQKISPEAQTVLQLKDKLPTKQQPLHNKADLVY
jgi:hypothetical protein